VGRRKFVGGVRVSTGRGCLLARESEGHLCSLRNFGAGEDSDKCAPLCPAGVGEVIAVPAGGDAGADRRPTGAAAEGRVIFDGTLERAVNAPGEGSADGAQAATVEGWYVQADVGPYDDGRNRFPEEMPGGPWGLAGELPGLPGRVAHIRPSPPLLPRCARCGGGLLTLERGGIRDRWRPGRLP